MSNMAKLDILCVHTKFSVRTFKYFHLELEAFALFIEMNSAMNIVFEELLPVLEWAEIVSKSLGLVKTLTVAVTLFQSSFIQ